MEILDIDVRRQQAYNEIKNTFDKSGYHSNTDQAPDHWERSWWSRWWGYDFYYDWKYTYSSANSIGLIIAQSVDLENVSYELREIEKKYGLGITINKSPEERFWATTKCCEGY